MIRGAALAAVLSNELPAELLFWVMLASKVATGLIACT
jgi:hypothetical protein